MSRSFKNFPCGGFTTALSDKAGKTDNNRALRCHNRIHIRRFLNGDADDLPVMPLLREVGNVWDFPKDGKSYFSESNFRIRKIRLKGRTIGKMPKYFRGNPDDERDKYFRLYMRK